MSYYIRSKLTYEHLKVNVSESGCLPLGYVLKLLDPHLQLLGHVVPLPTPSRAVAVPQIVEPLLV